MKVTESYGDVPTSILSLKPEIDSRQEILS